MQPSVPPVLGRRDLVGGFTRLVRDLDPRLIDVLISLVLSSVAVAIVLGRPAEGNDFRNDDVLGVALLLGQTLPLALRRASPLGVLGAIVVALVAHSAIGYEVVEAGTFSSLIAVYGAASLTDSRGRVLAAAITAAAIAGFFATNRGDWSLLDVAATSATWAMGWLLGTFVAIRGEQAEAAGARVASLELEQEARAREAVADERARVARELHDIIGHALNLIVIQASGAQRVFDMKPDIPRDALASIESTGREALEDMERMLGVLSGTDLHDGGLALNQGLPSLIALPPTYRKRAFRLRSWWKETGLKSPPALNCPHTG
jgi:signal transduction histidine kinase